jgi:nicotinamidase-related amidase
MQKIEHWSVDAQKRFLFPTEDGMGVNDIDAGHIPLGTLSFADDLAKQGIDTKIIVTEPNIYCQTIHISQAEAVPNSLHGQYGLAAEIIDRLPGDVYSKPDFDGNSAMKNEKLKKHFHDASLDTVILTGVYVPCVVDTAIDVLKTGARCMIANDLFRDNRTNDTPEARKARAFERVSSSYPQADLSRLIIADRHDLLQMIKQQHHDMA